MTAKTAACGQTKKRLHQLHQWLWNQYGAQGWWPLADGDPPYHVGDYSLPHSDAQRFEIMLGAVLTQNTNWNQVVKALANLRDLGIIQPSDLLACDQQALKTAIRPAGYFNQKAGYLLNLAEFVIQTGFACPSREELLQVQGVGQETADSILLYAFHQPEFVIDAYTLRLLQHLNWVGERCRYQEAKGLFQEHLPADVVMFQEYHALIVRHAKDYYSRKPYGVDDPLVQAMSPLIHV